MPSPLARPRRHRTAVACGLIASVSLAAFFLTKRSGPATIAIGTGVRGGLYVAEGEWLAAELTRVGGNAATVRETAGSGENVDLLRRGVVDAAIVQAGSVSLDGLAVATPLQRDVVTVLVRAELLGSGEVASVADLAGRDVAVGLPDSGMRSSAADVLKHYRLRDRVRAVDVHFTELPADRDPPLAAAVVTTGIDNDDLARLLGTGRFGLLPLDAAALATRYRHFEPFTIPPRLWPPIPGLPVETVAVSSLLVVREDAGDALVTDLLRAVYEGDLTARVATFEPERARTADVPRLHPAASRYHDPFGRYGVLHTVLEGLVAGKELLLAIGAGLYLVWDRARRRREKAAVAARQAEKDRLDVYLERTLLIEREAASVTEPARLRELLDEVTAIKLEALDRLTHEDLRGDTTFSIFLAQCANLISKLQLRILETTRPG